MKKNNFILLVIIAVILTACDFLTSESNYTPNIFFAKNPTNNIDETIYIYPTDDPNAYLLDTISVGDTISVFLRITGNGNDLTAFYLKTDVDGLIKVILPEKNVLDSSFVATSNYEDGDFLISGEYTDLNFPFQYVALLPTNGAKMTFTIVSDAQFDDPTMGSNTCSITLKSPIVIKTEE